MIKNLTDVSKRIRDLRKRIDRLGLAGALNSYIKAERNFHEYLEEVLEADEKNDSAEVSRLSRSAPSVFRMLDSATYMLEPQIKKQLARIRYNNESKIILEEIFDKHHI